MNDKIAGNLKLIYSCLDGVQEFEEPLGNQDRNLTPLTQNHLMRASLNMSFHQGDFECANLGVRKFSEICVLLFS